MPPTFATLADPGPRDGVARNGRMQVNQAEDSINLVPSPATDAILTPLEAGEAVDETIVAYKRMFQNCSASIF